MKASVQIFLVVTLVTLCKGQICNIHCDGRNPELAVNARAPVSTTIFGRTIRLLISDDDNMGFAEISNGDPTDEVWIDRSMNGGVSWDGKLGDTRIPNGARYFLFMQAHSHFMK